MSNFDHLSIHIPKSHYPRVVIVGGGFGGLKLSRMLVKEKFQVVLMDRNNYHVFQPLLYQVATAGLEADAIAGPMRKLIKEYDNFFFRMLRVLKVDVESKKVSTKVGDISYDYLILANGAKTNFFGNDQIMKNAFPLKQLSHALDLRSHLLQNFEKAVLSNERAYVESLLNVVVVGGGPTGVEVAGALAELKGHVLPKDYPELNFRQMNIYLIEGTDRLLNGMSQNSGDKAHYYLDGLMVNVITGKFVQSYENNVVKLNDDTEIHTQTLIWAAGVMGSIIDGIPKELVEKSRILVNEFNQVNGFENFYAIGDVACMKSEKFPKGHPMVAPVAIQQAEHLVKNLKLQMQGKEMLGFDYTNKGSMATIGRNRAVVDLPGDIKFTGLFAWAVWMFVHLMSIVGFKNKFIIFINWLWNYFTYDRGNRLIVRFFNPTLKDYEENQSDLYTDNDE